MARGGDGLQVLSSLDAAKTQWYHFTAIIVAGMGFFTDAYDLFCISLVTKLLGRIYYTDTSEDTPGSLPPSVAAVAFCGTLAGQLFFGWLGDKLDRKSVYGMAPMLMVICSIASGLSFGHTPTGVMATLCFFRFWLGFGIGGDYPLSATIMSEYANKKTRGAFIGAVFAMQGFGILAGGIVTLIISAAFRAGYPAPAYRDDHVSSTVPQADLVWRIILMLGAVPALLTYYWRMKMHETVRYTALVAKKVKQAEADMSKVLQTEIVDELEKQDEMFTAESNTVGVFSKYFARRHGLHLATCWFLLDIALYGQNLFQKDSFTSINWIPKASTMSALEEVLRISRAQTLIALCGTVPGYWFTVALIDAVGRFAIQLLGLFMMTVLTLVLAIVMAALLPCLQFQLQLLILSCTLAASAASGSSLPVPPAPAPGPAVCMPGMTAPFLLRQARPFCGGTLGSATCCTVEDDAKLRQAFMEDLKKHDYYGRDPHCTSKVKAIICAVCLPLSEPFNSTTAGGVSNDNSSLCAAPSAPIQHDLTSRRTQPPTPEPEWLLADDNDKAPTTPKWLISLIASVLSALATLFGVVTYKKCKGKATLECCNNNQCCSNIMCCLW